MLDAVIFDLGGVVLQWEPERAYERVLPAGDVAAFLERIDFRAWNRRNDGGHRFADAEAELIERFPDDAAAIRAYREHFAHALTGMVPGTSAVIAELGRAGVGLTALTNWSGETFPVARERFGILRRFTDILVSGDEAMLKPDPAIFALACERAGLDPARTVFIDDGAANVEAAERYGLTGLVFTDATTLRADLVRLGLVGERAAIGRRIFHWALRSEWAAATQTGVYPWSSRGVTYDAEGFVHLSFAEQVADTRRRYYADLADAELVLLELDPDATEVPVVVEPGGGSEFPHLFAPLPVAEMTVHAADWRA
ncbi:HAD-IA family hydrolase [Microlunatus ginsengisoli]|uniref:HAD-IA family hydrolase n=1 Tax=Microlunatus ginsengisoli TaxID=363863 RepID=A0ABP6ZCX1_9ACTN